MQAMTTPTTVRPAAERGLTRLEWLDSRHSFSFGGYHDPDWLGFRALRVINDDRVAPGGGFGTHPHRDMEILTWVLEGAVEHRDSLGNTQVIRAGELQRMSAGTGVTHGELNPSDAEELRFLQVWIVPEREGLEPSYEQRPFERAARRGRWQLLASRDGREGSLTVHQDVEVKATVLGEADELRHVVAEGRHAYLHVATGGVRVGERTLREGDGLVVSEAGDLVLGAAGAGEAEVLLFDLA
jgi:redox-sensitive bicupin YhaK (pirin superfamily)